jgi:hypothetical protein
MNDVHSLSHTKWNCKLILDEHFVLTTLILTRTVNRLVKH